MSKRYRTKPGPAINPNSLRQKCIAAGVPYHRTVQRIRSGWTESAALSSGRMQSKQLSVAEVLKRTQLP